MRLRVEELEGRSTPAVLAAPDGGFDHTAVVATREPVSAIDAVGQTDNVPLHVSLAAVAAVALCVSWDRRTRQHHLRRPALRMPVKSI